MSNKRDLVKEAAASTKNLQVNEIHSKFCVLNLLRYEYIAINVFIKEFLRTSFRPCKQIKSFKIHKIIS